MPALKNARQEAFCRFYTNGETPPRAYALAGFSEKTASEGSSRLLKNPDVSRRVEELLAEKEKAHAQVVQKAMENAGVDKEWVMKNLKEVAERSMQHAPVIDREGKQVIIETPDGEIAGAFTFDAKAAVAALVPLGKELGMFVDRKEIRHGKLEDMPDEALDDLIRELAKEAGITPKVMH